MTRGPSLSSELNTSDYAYLLPEDRIAQRPADQRDASRLLCLDRQTGEVEHRQFKEVSHVLRQPSLLVVNDTRVFPARLRGQLSTGGKVELLLIAPLDDGETAQRWSCMGKPRRKLRTGAAMWFGPIGGVVIEARDDGLDVELRCESGVRRALEESGRIPLPPYIRREDDLEDRERYQTIFASQADGSVAAPTAGLHFTERVIADLESAGHRLAKVTLHVGPGTFRPVRAETLDSHHMDGEWCEVSESTAEAIETARVEGRRIVAVGTTVVRTLESAVTTDGQVEPRRGMTELFIVPGHRFRVVEGLLTNFHLPRSTLLALVCAFAGRENVLAAYAAALRAEYRFYSYGDAMLIQ